MRRDLSHRLVALRYKVNVELRASRVTSESSSDCAPNAPRDGALSVVAVEKSPLSGGIRGAPHHRRVRRAARFTGGLFVSDFAARVSLLTSRSRLASAPEKTNAGRLSKSARPLDHPGAGARRTSPNFRRPRPLDRDPTRRLIWSFFPFRVVPICAAVYVSPKCERGLHRSGSLYA